ncbi:hypothetical protein PC111_g12432 [Phytophthora cactorum]|nr:hypothetical protein PC111_g12432 [Phytophthora cactorum]KAG2833244.1 hypothetical protein PC112_g6589 [Phytophthora cactorum]KAG3168664.1 hypothetical protein C6341_g11243 [Phytophthora cactorum]KAG3196933.1 hypothetical protein PC128_g7220 [Phytophthora cactorum]KAG4051974.1 hypothetical protein PC123_g12836 [Phytophthora cactorum]
MSSDHPVVLIAVNPSGSSGHQKARATARGDARVTDSAAARATDSGVVSVIVCGAARVAIRIGHSPNERLHVLGMAKNTSVFRNLACRCTFNERLMSW